MNKNERMRALNKAGIDTGKYFSVDLPNGLKPGAKISLVINENGDPVIVSDNYNIDTVMNDDYIAKQIIEDGYVRNTKLHRRFVMAQMFQMLNYKSYDGKETGFDAALRHYGYGYQFKMMLEEIKVLSKLEVRDAETFNERKHFFTKDVVVKTCNDYLKKLKEYIDDFKTFNCKGVPYKKVRGVNIFCEDLNKKVYNPIQLQIYKINSARSYTEMYKLLSKFVSGMMRLPYNTPKCKDWVDTYKGEGAFYTLKNLIMFHNCVVIDERGYMYRGVGNSMGYLNAMLEKYQGEGWRMFALMKKVIRDNHFDFDRAMSRIYNK